MYSGRSGKHVGSRINKQYPTMRREKGLHVCAGHGRTASAVWDRLVVRVWNRVETSIFGNVWMPAGRLHPYTAIRGKQVAGPVECARSKLHTAMWERYSTGVPRTTWDVIACSVYSRAKDAPIDIVRRTLTEVIRKRRGT